MSWHFSQAAVAAFSKAHSLGGAPSALSKSTSIADAFLCNGRMTASSNHFPSGMMSQPLTADHGMDSWMLSLAASRVSTSAVQARVPESTATAPVSGGKWQESYLRFDPSASGWKTHQCLFDEDLPESSVTLPAWGMMRDGVLWEPTTPALRTVGNGSGYSEHFPTPDCQNHRDGSQKRTPAPGRKEGRGDLIQAVRGNPNKHFATPTAKANQLSPSMRKWKECLNMWPTPASIRSGTLWPECREPQRTDRTRRGGWNRLPEPGLGGVVDAMANRMDLP